MKHLLLCCLLMALMPLRCFGNSVADDNQISADDLEAYLGSFIQGEMRAFHIPGALVMVVSNGKILLARGYGYSNLETQEHVHPYKSLFRMGSISKLLTTTAVLQLEEQGKLNLQEDVNRYLKTFQLDDPFPEPVRVFNLLTHTSGFDERNIGSATTIESHVVPLGKYLAERMPPVVRPPGSLISYSNHGFTLAGYLVEAISGMPFEDYVHQNILKPLGMNKSSFHLRKELIPQVATGYLFENKKHVPAPFDYFNDGPADSFITTAPDMARFMIANLQHGRYENVRILKPETMDQMEKLQYTHHPGMPGWCLGYWEEYRNNLRGIVHDGCVFGSTTRVYLVPEKNFGLFVATNIDITNHGDLTNVVTARVLDYLFPQEGRNKRPESTADFLKRAHAYEGHYRHVCAASCTIEKLALLMGLVGEIDVKVSSADTLTINGKEFIETAPLFFEQTNGRSFASFRQNAEGAMTNVFLDTDAFEKIHLYDTNKFQMYFAGVCLLSFVLSGIIWLIWTLRAHRSDIPASLHNTTALIAVVHLVFVAILILTFLRKRLFELSYDVSPVLKAALVLPLIAVALTTLMLVFLFRAWRNQIGALRQRLYFSWTAIAAVAFLWVLNYWNLIGFNY